MWTSCPLSGSIRGIKLSSRIDTAASATSFSTVSSPMERSTLSSSPSLCSACSHWHRSSSLYCKWTRRSTNRDATRQGLACGAPASAARTRPPLAWHYRVRLLCGFRSIPCHSIPFWFWFWFWLCSRCVYVSVGVVFSPRRICDRGNASCRLRAVAACCSRGAETRQIRRGRGTRRPEIRAIAAVSERHGSEE